MSIESILNDLAKTGQLKDDATTSKNCQAAINLITKNSSYDKATKTETHQETVSHLVNLFVEVTRQRMSLDEFFSTTSDYFAKEAVNKALKSAYATNKAALEEAHATFFTDLPHVVGVSSSVNHHIRDFALTGSTNQETVGALQIGNGEDVKPRSVANFVFALDLASKGILSSDASGLDEEQQQAAGDGKRQIAFQCTTEQAQELASILRAAADAMQRVETRLEKK